MGFWFSQPVLKLRKGLKAADSSSVLHKKLDRHNSSFCYLYSVFWERLALECGSVFKLPCLCLCRDSQSCAFQPHYPPIKVPIYLPPLKRTSRVCLMKGRRASAPLRAAETTTTTVSECWQSKHSWAPRITLAHVHTHNAEEGQQRKATMAQRNNLISTQNPRSQTHVHKQDAHEGKVVDKLTVFGCSAAKL